MRSKNLFFGGAINFTQNATRYFYLNGKGGALLFESWGAIPIAHAGAFKNFYVHMESAPGLAQSVTITLRVNGVDTALTCTITGLAQTGNDLTHRVTVNVGDLVCYKIVASAAATVSSPKVSIEFDV